MIFITFIDIKSLSQDLRKAPKIKLLISAQKANKVLWSSFEKMVVWSVNENKNML